MGLAASARIGPTPRIGLLAEFCEQSRAIAISCKVQPRFAASVYNRRPWISSFQMRVPAKCSTPICPAAGVSNGRKKTRFIPLPVLSSIGHGILFDATAQLHPEGRLI